MTTITIEVPEGFEFGNKVNGEFVRTYPDKWDNSWKLEILRYGHRKINDTCKADDGQKRLELAVEMAKEMNNGDAFVGRSRGGAATMSSLERLTITYAKRELTRRFKLLTKCGRIADMTAANEKVAAYFEGTTWIDAKVVEWNESANGQAFDAKGQAQAEIDAMKELAESVSVDDI